MPFGARIVALFYPHQVRRESSLNRLCAAVTCVNDRCKTTRCAYVVTSFEVFKVWVGGVEGEGCIDGLAS